MKICVENLLDREWRLDHLYMIKNKDGVRVPFSRNAAQRDFDKKKHCKNIILKSRQLGFSTFECLDALDEALFTTDRNVYALIIGHNKDAMEELFGEKIKFAWEALPDELRKYWYVSSDTAKSFTFDLQKNGKHLNKLAVVSTARSGSPTRIHCTELAYLDEKYPSRSDEIIAGGLPAIPSGYDGRFDIESTARDDDWGNFRRLCKNAIKKMESGEPLTTSDFKFHFYNWQWDEYGLSKITDDVVRDVFPQITDDFFQYRNEKKKFDGIEITDRELVYYFLRFLELRRDETRGNPMAALKKEYPTTYEEAFESSADPLFSEMSVKKTNIIAPRYDGSWAYVRDYVPGHAYALGADVAEGVGGDSSTATIIDLTVREVVARFRSNSIAPDIFAFELAKGGRMYGECAVAPERNNHGHTTVSKLREIYPEEKIYQYTTTDSSTDVTTKKYGWDSNGATKPKMLYELATAIDNGLSLNFAEIAKEVLSYPKSGARERKSTTATKHWDLVISTAIAWVTRDFAFDVHAASRKRDFATVYDEDGIMDF